MFWSSLAFCGEIHQAAKQGDLAKVEALLKDNPNLVSSKNNNEDTTPLHYAAMRANKDVAKLLLAHGAEVNARGYKDMTPLHYAAAYGRKDVVELLLANKADINVKNKYGATPLHLAAIESHKDMVELLLANKADVNAMNMEGYTPLHEAVACEKFGCKEVVELLLANKADINAQGEIYGWTPLHCAAMYGKKDMVELLLTNKADANAKDVDGSTPLHLATVHCEKGDCKEVVEFLRKNGGHE